MAKAAEAFRTISEASKEIGVPQHVLRHWEDVFGQIRPMRRAGGRRYYRPVDLDLLRGVHVLLYDERYTTKGVQKIFRENGAKFIIEIGQRGEFTAPEAIKDKSSDHGPGDKGASSQGSHPQSNESAALSLSSSHNNAEDLESLITRLEQVQDTLDNTILAIDAILAQTTPGSD